jgi:antitoxin component YwqK of YwqJK toxin-antitoxin module
MIWDDNGTLRVEMAYQNGERTGVWKRWNEQGEMLGEKSYN